MKRHVAVGLAVAAGLGLLLLPYPFHGDQALFTLSAARLREGAVLYADLWDLKQPGVFLFYLAGGTVFGFHEVGIHLFELTYLLLGAGAITWLLRGQLDSAFALGGLPVLTVGAYYASVVYPGALTQLEILIGIPLFLMLWLCAAALEDGRSIYWFLAGVLAGVVLLFKSMLVLVVIPVWSAVVVPGLANRSIRTRDALRGAGFFAAGVLLAWVPFAVYVVRHDLWDIVVFTYLTVPPQALQLYPRPLSRLIRAVGWFIVMFSPLLLMAGIFLGRGRRSSALATGLVAWFVSGLIVVLMQHWWSYQFYLLLIPLGILATMGLDRLLMDGVRVRSVLAFATVLCLPMLYFTVDRTASLVNHRLALRRADLLAYQTENWRRYGDLSALVSETAFLGDPGTARGPIYVIGDPVYQYRSGRDPAGSLFAWSMPMWPPELWDQALTDLVVIRPPYLFMQRSYEAQVADRGAALADEIAATYTELKAGSAGTWYVRSDLAP